MIDNIGNIIFWLNVVDVLIHASILPHYKTFMLKFRG